MIGATITIYGTPAPQGSKRFVGLSKTGRGILVESSAKVKPWREAVLFAAREHGAKIEGPVHLWVWFTLAKPKSAPKTRRTWPDKKPDLSKLVRSTEDALVDAGTIEDDARIIQCLSMKVFPGEHDMALDVPGAVIEIRSATA
jgi:crossover junction endodeoxyribonuclease RusA